jgi:hypothetical protein
MMVQRSVKHPYMTLFDGADMNTSTAQRSSSLTPLQALYFMNSAFPRRCADNLAGLLNADPPSTNAVAAQKAGSAKVKLDSIQHASIADDDKDRINSAFLIIYGRLPEKSEQQRSIQFLHDVSAKYLAAGDDPSKASQQALSHLMQVMFSSNEFMFIE